MTHLELSELKALRDMLDKYTSINMPEDYISEEDAAVASEFVESLISKYNWKVLASDTGHHCDDSRGFYEVKFELETENGMIFITTQDGYEDLEEKWSSEETYTETTLGETGLLYASDWRYFLKNIIEKFEVECLCNNKFISQKHTIEIRRGMFIQQ